MDVMRIISPGQYKRAITALSRGASATTNPQKKFVTRVTVGY